MMKTFLSFRNFTRLFLSGAVFLASLGLTSAAMAQPGGSAPQALQQDNSLAPAATNQVYFGQVLNTSSGASASSYTVQKGDTLYSIGRRFNLSVAELQEANPGISSTIYIGQVLNIPARIRFAAGGTAAILQGQLGANSKQVYLLGAGAGQTLETTLSAPNGLTLAILGADGSALQNASSNSTFRGVLPKTQDYVLMLASGGSAADFGLSVAIPERIRFSSGSDSAVLSGAIPAGPGQYFILQAAKGQTLNVSAAPQDQLQLIIYGVDGSVLRSGMGQGASFSGVLPGTQDYILVLRSANQGQAFTLNVSIPAGTSIPATSTRSYTVQKGDTLLRIAVRFQTTVTVLLRANPQITDRNVIKVGQVIDLPGATLTLANGQTIYIASSGDTLGAVAARFNTTLSALIGANPQISNPNLIFPGQRIHIP